MANDDTTTALIGGFIKGIERGLLVRQENIRFQKQQEFREREITIKEKALTAGITQDQKFKEELNALKIQNIKSQIESRSEKARVTGEAQTLSLEKSRDQRDDDLKTLRDEGIRLERRALESTRGSERRLEFLKKIKANNDRRRTLVDDINRINRSLGKETRIEGPSRAALSPTGTIVSESISGAESVTELNEIVEAVSKRFDLLSKQEQDEIGKLILQRQNELEKGESDSGKIFGIF